MTKNIRAWLGPAANQLSAAQIDLISNACDEIERRYPDPDDSDVRDAALSAVVMHRLNETTPEYVCRELDTARRREAMAFAAAVQVAVELVRDGTPKAAAARVCGIDRMALLRALGER